MATQSHKTTSLLVKSAYDLMLSFAGYWQQQEETDKAIYDGYFHTGDLAVWDEYNNIHIVDRKKDVIISGGENVSSPDIEDVLYKHPSVVVSTAT